MMNLLLVVPQQVQTVQSQSISKIDPCLDHLYHQHLHVLNSGIQSQGHGAKCLAEKKNGELDFKWENGQ